MTAASEPWSVPIAAVSATDAAELADRAFGLDASATTLASERDQNFALTCADGGRYVLKLTHPAEPRSFTLWQTAALLHAARRDPALPLPQLVAARDGAAHADIEVGGVRRIARVMTLLPGIPLWRANPHPGQHEAIGCALARLHQALDTLDCEPAPIDLLWDLRRAPRLGDLLPHITDDAERATVAQVLDELERHTLPSLARLPTQALHNDFQPWNLLVDETESACITGIIDFGDMVAAPRIMDLAVACAYHLADAPATTPLADIAAITQGYESRLPLASAERALLLPLVAGRLAMTLAITSWRARLHPDNASYILRNAGAARTGLGRLARH